MDSGFAGGEDDMYNVYDKPWRAGQGLAEKIYRPGKNVDKDIYGDDVEKLIKSNRCVLCVCVCMCVCIRACMLERGEFLVL